MTAGKHGRVEQARAQLERMILSGELQGGERLNEFALSAQLGISRAHLREAVRALEEAKLVQIVANRGAQVRKLDLAEALELFDIRAGFARSAGRLAVLRGTRAQIQQLQAIHRRMGTAALKGNLAKFHELNHDFHASLFDVAANARLREIDLTIRNEIQLYIRRNVSSEAQVHLSHVEHGDIIAALLARDANACAAAFERHVLNGKQRLMESSTLASAAS